MQRSHFISKLEDDKNSISHIGRFHKYFPIIKHLYINNPKKALQLIHDLTLPRLLDSPSNIYSMAKTFSLCVDLLGDVPATFYQYPNHTIHFPEATAKLLLKQPNPIPLLEKEVENCIKLLGDYNIYGTSKALFYYLVQLTLLQPENAVNNFSRYFQALDHATSWTQKGKNLVSNLKNAPGPHFCAPWILEPELRKLFENPSQVFRILKHFEDHFSPGVKALMLFKAIMATDNAKLKLEAGALMAKALEENNELCE